MVTVVKPPNISDVKGFPVKIFLGGSIEMDKAKKWQDLAEKLIFIGSEKIKGDIVVLNPRRDSWDSSLKQSIDCPEFKEQVDWELDALDASDYIIMNFDPETMSPISLLELGLHAMSSNLLVICPDGFWRKGNVDIVCKRYGIGQFPTLEAAVDFIFDKEVKRESEAFSFSSKISSNVKGFKR